MKKLFHEIAYYWWLFKLNFREWRLRLLGIDRKFYCQNQIEDSKKCKIQCEHCKCYYKPLEEQYKEYNDGTGKK